MRSIPIIVTGKEESIVLSPEAVELQYPGGRTIAAHTKDPLIRKIVRRNASYFSIPVREIEERIFSAILECQDGALEEVIFPASSTHRARLHAAKLCVGGKKLVELLEK